MSNYIATTQILEVNFNWFGDCYLPFSICRYGTNVMRPDSQGSNPKGCSARPLLAMKGGVVRL